MNIYQRINEVRKSVSYVKKDKAVQTYKAVEHDAVVAIVREHFVKNGIVVYPEQVRGLLNPQGQKPSKDGNSVVPDHMRLYEAGYRIHFVNVDEPADRLTVDIEAHAIDNGDKAPGKAVTYATKAALLKVLMLETGESDESRAESTRTISDEQVEELTKTLEESGADIAKFLAWAGAPSIEEIPAKKYSACLNAAKQKKAKAAANG